MAERITTQGYRAMQGAGPGPEPDDEPHFDVKEESKKYWKARRALTNWAAYGAGDPASDAEAQRNQYIVSDIEGRDRFGEVWNQDHEWKYREEQLQIYARARNERGGSTAEDDVRARVSGVQERLEGRAAVQRVNPGGRAGAPAPPPRQPPQGRGPGALDVLIGPHVQSLERQQAAQDWLMGKIPLVSFTPEAEASAAQYRRLLPHRQQEASRWLTQKIPFVRQRSR